MRTRVAVFITVWVLTVLPCRTAAEITFYLDEAQYLAAIQDKGYTSFTEGFETSAWDGVRSNYAQVNAATSVESNGIVWTSSDRVTTSGGAGRNGYGLYSYYHGIPDRLFGQSGQRLYGIGGWVDTNTPPAKINFFLDSVTMVDFDDQNLGTTYQFFGVIDTSGFSEFEIREMEGTVGDQKYIFTDDFTFATGSNEIWSTWHGYTESWDISSNWSAGIVPDRFTHVIIPSTPSGGGFPVIDSGISESALDLTINGGGLSISDGSLTLSS